VFYLYHVTVPKSTAKADPLITDMVLGPGEIVKVGVGFTWGCAGLVHVTIYRAEQQMWPSNPEESFHWNNHYYEWQESVDCEGPTEHWSIRCWSLDNRNAGEVEVVINILPLEKTMFGKIAQSLFGGPKK